MVVLITGATGSVGRALARALRREGHVVVAAVRDLARARSALGPEIELMNLRDDRALADAIERADALVNLAGEAIAERHWTRRRKRALVESRVDLTRRLSAFVQSARTPPRVLVSASAIGIYPDAGDRPQDEESAPARGFLAALCAAWEEAALRSQSARTRVVCLRIGIVLEAESGALRKLLPLHRLGLGGPLGSGDQYVSWIHLDDLLRVITVALERDALEGIVNATAPHPVSQRTLARTLAAHLGRPAVLPVPALVLRAALGARAELLLKSQRIVPRALARAGFAFVYPNLDAAVSEIVGRERESARIAPARGARAEDPTQAAHVLTQVTRLEAPLDQVFTFFARAENLGWITPPWMGFAILGEPPEEIREGTFIAYRIRIGPLPLRWRTRIAVFRPGECFVDSQERGPYRLWWHEHRFEPDGSGTRMVDRVLFRLPLGKIGNLVAGFVVRGMLRRIFAYRAQAMAHRFGGGELAARVRDRRRDAAE